MQLPSTASQPSVSTFSTQPQFSISASTHHQLASSVLSNFLHSLTDLTFIDSKLKYSNSTEHHQSQRERLHLTLVHPNYNYYFHIQVKR